MDIHQDFVIVFRSFAEHSLRGSFNNRTHHLVHALPVFNTVRRTAQYGHASFVIPRYAFWKFRIFQWNRSSRRAGSSRVRAYHTATEFTVRISRGSDISHLISYFNPFVQEYRLGGSPFHRSFRAVQLIRFVRRNLNAFRIISFASFRSRWRITTSRTSSHRARTPDTLAVARYRRR